MKSYAERCSELPRLNFDRLMSGTGSPKILVGCINISGISFQTIKMIELGASLVAMTLDPAEAKYRERLYVNPYRPFTHSLKNLPPKWRPDFFLDSQVEHGHILPPGTGDLPFPTIASFNHAHLGQNLLHLEGMFDCLIRPSTKMPWGDAYLPWGASWGAMGFRIGSFTDLNPSGPRPIDVSCTIGTNGLGKESLRHRVVKEIENLKTRRPEWNIHLGSGLGLKEYFTLLGQSKVSINVGAWGCTMTYRPLEVIAQGSALVQVDETAYGSRSKLSEFFEPHWYIESSVNGLEDAIECGLKKTRDEKTKIIEELEVRFSYEEQHKRLFDLAATVKMKERLPLKDWSRRAYAINHLVDYDDYAAIHDWSLTEADKKSLTEYTDGDWDACLWQPKDPELRYRWQTELALRRREPREIYRQYSEEDKATA